MAELFQRDKSVISRHIKNDFEEGELSSLATVAEFATVQSEGDRRVSREIEFFSLDVIISVGYRVKSHRGTQFRIWATQRLREYLVKGFVMDDDSVEWCRMHVLLSRPISRTQQNRPKPWSQSVAANPGSAIAPARGC